MGPVAVGDHRFLTRIPDGWSFTEAATVPIAFLTAYYGLARLGDLTAGERVLIHTATGAVGMAAIQVARHLGAEVFATAGPAKWDTLRSWGVPGDHIASSRDDEFEARFQPGVDVVLNSLAGALTDASLRLLAPGGRFLDMGKTDGRDPREVAARHDGVVYTQFDIRDPGPVEVRALLDDLVALFEAGVLKPIPATVRHITQAPQAFRHMAEARHTGKVVLRIRDWPSDRAVLITGGLGTVGSSIARHLVRAHGVRGLVLVGRRGLSTPGGSALVNELTRLGAEVVVSTADVGDREAVTDLVTGLGKQGVRVGAVVHAAGLTRDKAATALRAADFEEVLRAKALAATHLHEATKHLDLSAFVLCSSVAGTLGAAGQANYAAANAFLDGLAEYRNTQGMPALSIALGLWESGSGITSRLTDLDRRRLASRGVLPMSELQGLRLFDQAVRIGSGALVAAVLDDSAVVQPPAPVTPAGSVVRQRVPLLDMVCAAAAEVLGLEPGDVVEPDARFRELGLDSLGAIELRDKVATATGVALPATLIFDYPTPVDLVAHLSAQIDTHTPDLSGIERLFDGRAADADLAAEVLRRVRELMEQAETGR
jgi:NADP-dependent 3-hydroxy acid dehydrogenase YdfG/acyl carrier protein